MLKSSELFSYVTLVTDNPTTLDTVEVFKEGDKVVRKNKSETFDLKSGDLLTRLKESEEIEVLFYNKGLKKIFKRYNIDNLSKTIDSISSSHYWIITNKLISSILEYHKINLCDVIIDERLDNEIIVGYKYSHYILNEKTDEYYIGLDQIRVLKLN